MSYTRRFFLALATILAAPFIKAETMPIETEPQDPKEAGFRLTRPDGTPIYVNPHAVAFVRAPIAGEHGNATLVFTNGAKQQVMETVDDVIHGLTLKKQTKP